MNPVFENRGHSMNFNTNHRQSPIDFKPKTKKFNEPRNVNLYHPRASDVAKESLKSYFDTITSSQIDIKKMSIERNRIRD